MTGSPQERVAAGRGLFRWHLSPTFIAHLFKAIFKQHHRELLPVLRPLIPRDAIVLDVGAHAGQFTKLFAGLADRGLVLAIEPGSYARVILRIAVLLRRLHNVVILPFALGETPSLAMLTMPIKRPGSYGFGLSHLGLSHVRPGGGHGATTVEPVAVTTLDELAAALDLARLDFIKADIEGWEAHLLRGGLHTLRRLRPVLFMEMNEAQLARAGGDLAAIWNLLAGLGYRPHLAAGDVLEPVASPRQGDILWLPSADAPPHQAEPAQ